MVENKEVGRHVYVFGESNGGESFSLTTTYHDNGDDGVFINQELSLQSYCNSASFNLNGTLLTPDNLRELANQLESSSIHNGALKIE